MEVIRQIADFVQTEDFVQTADFGQTEDFGQTGHYEQTAAIEKPLNFVRKVAVEKSTENSAHLAGFICSDFGKEARVARFQREWIDLIECLLGL